MPLHLGWDKVANMTRETKLGLVVSCSFLCLLGVVLGLKMTEDEPEIPPETTKPTAQQTETPQTPDSSGDTGLLAHRGGTRGEGSPPREVPPEDEEEWDEEDPPSGAPGILQASVRENAATVGAGRTNESTAVALALAQDREKQEKSQKDDPSTSGISVPPLPQGKSTTVAPPLPPALPAGIPLLPGKPGENPSASQGEKPASLSPAPVKPGTEGGGTPAPNAGTSPLPPVAAVPIPPLPSLRGDGNPSKPQSPPGVPPLPTQNEATKPPPPPVALPTPPTPPTPKEEKPPTFREEKPPIPKEEKPTPPREPATASPPPVPPVPEAKPATPGTGSGVPLPPLPKVDENSPGESPPPKEIPMPGVRNPMDPPRGAGLPPTRSEDKSPPGGIPMPPIPAIPAAPSEGNPGTPPPLPTLPVEGSKPPPPSSEKPEKSVLPVPAIPAPEKPRNGSPEPVTITVGGPVEPEKAAPQRLAQDPPTSPPRVPTGSSGGVMPGDRRLTPPSADTAPDSPTTQPTRPAARAGESGRPTVVGNTPPSALVPPITVPDGTGRPPAVQLLQPRVISFTEEIYLCKENETFETVSANKYGSDRYAQALQLFNRSHPLIGAEAIPVGGVLARGQKLFLPPAEVLENRYPMAIKPVTPVRTERQQSGASPSAPPAAPPGRKYTVAPGGEMIRQVAERELGNKDRWYEIAQLNPGWQPEYRIPGGTVLLLPSGKP